MSLPIATPAEMIREAEAIEAGTHPVYGPATPAVLRRLAARTLRDRAAHTPR